MDDVDGSLCSAWSVAIGKTDNLTSSRRLPETEFNTQSEIESARQKVA